MLEVLLLALLGGFVAAGLFTLLRWAGGRFGRAARKFQGSDNPEWGRPSASVWDQSRSSGGEDDGAP